MSCYFIAIHNPLQYDYIVALLSAGLSFCQTLRVIQENRDILGASIKLGGVSEGDASNFSRITYALGIQMIADLMSHSWAFLVATDVSTDGFGSSHLDLRIRIPGRDVANDLLSFHLMEAPHSIEFAADDNVGELLSEANVAPHHTRHVVSRRADNLHPPRRTECVKNLQE